MKMSKEGFPFVGASALFGFLLLYVWPLASVLAGIVTVLVILFFRDPSRAIARQPDALTAPADGKVLEVCQINDERFIRGSATKISIYLSLLDVHINRSPFAGSVAFTEYHCGRFLPAFLSKASNVNERNLIGIETARGKLVVTQMAGFFGRRIICHVREGDSISTGQKVGLIKFGSRTELLVPAHQVEVTVKPGDKLKAGETVIGRWLE